MPRFLLHGLLLAVACSHGGRTAKPTPDSGVPQSPLDRLLPGELGKSSLLVFGLAIPQGMQVKHRYPDSVVLSGSVSASLLAQYVETHALVGVAEQVGRRKMYKDAKIRGGDSNRSYLIEIDDLPGEKQLTITDATPRQPQPNLSDDERWRRAGYLPDGTPIASAQSM